MVVIYFYLEQGSYKVVEIEQFILLLNKHFSFKCLKINVPYHIKTSQLISRANQLSDFYMMGNIGR